jgi:tetratricopeptide (TPR) repeat protein
VSAVENINTIVDRKMTPQQPTTISILLFTGLIIVICLLVWSVNQTAILKVEALGSEAKIEELSREVAALREELASVKAELAMTGGVIDHRVALTGSLTESANQVVNMIEEHDAEATMSIPSDIQSDSAEDNELEDMADPQQASSGLTDGKQALTKLNYSSAVESFTKVDSSAPDYIEARLGVANAWFYSHQYDKAIVEFAYVLKKKADSVEAAIGLANAHQRLGQRQQQIAAYDKAISIEPQQWLHYNSRATAYLMDGNNEDAIQDFRQAGRLASPVKADQATALENIGLIHLREQQWKQAYEHADEINKLDVKHSWNWLIRGIAAAKLKRNVDAYVSFDEWFKYKRSTDPYLLKQFLPESIHAFVDVSPAGLTKLVDPPLISGEPCENDSQCKSYACKPGPPFNKTNYCVAKDKDCSALDNIGYLLGEALEIDGIKVRCYQPEAGNARWTVDSRMTN